MKRAFEKLSEEPFDLLVIGGGVYGAWTAYDAALRGLRVALVEQGDWAGATSSASSKLIHGGLRYLEQFDFVLVRKSLDERRRLARLGPHRVVPLRFVLPVYRGDRVGRLRLRLGLWLYDRLAGFRDQPVQAHRSLDAASLSKRYDLLKPDGLRGGFLFGDCQTDDARFTLEIVDGALTAGAVAVNRAQAIGLIERNGRVCGAEVRDRLTRRTIRVQAGVTANCTGAWNRVLLTDAGPRTGPLRLTKGVHLVMPALPGSEGFLLSSRADRRIVFLIPWYGRTLLGTTDTDYPGDPAQVSAAVEDTEYLLAQANRVLSTTWSEIDVIARFSGLRTFPGLDGRSPSSVSREWKLEQPMPGLLASIGGKFTSARADSARTVDRALDLLGRPTLPCATDDRRFPWAPEEPLEEWQQREARRARALGLDEQAASSLLARHGIRSAQLLARIEERPELANRIVPDLPFCHAEIAHAVRSEMALSLNDVLRRRVPLALLERVRAIPLEAIGREVGGILGWSESRCNEEIREFLERQANWGVS